MKKSAVSIREKLVAKLTHTEWISRVAATVSEGISPAYGEVLQLTLNNVAAVRRSMRTALTSYWVPFKMSNLPFT